MRASSTGRVAVRSAALVRRQVALCFVIALSACTGSGLSGPGGVVPIAGPAPTSVAAPAGTMRTRIAIVRSPSTAGERRTPSRVSAKAVSVTVAVTSQAGGISPSSVTTDLPPRGCTVAVPCIVDGPALPPGVQNAIVVQSFDGTGGTGHALDRGSTTVTPAVGADTVIQIVLAGIPGSVKIAEPAPLAAGGSEKLGIVVVDADGDPIAGTFAMPVVITDPDTSGTGGTQIGGPAAASCPIGTCVALSSSVDTATLTYGGLAEGAQSLTSTVTSPSADQVTTGVTFVPSSAGIWVTAWGAAMTKQAAADTGAADQTIRTIVRTTVGSRGALRVHLSNVTGSQPVTVDALHVALVSTAPATVASSDRSIAFGGSGSVVIPAGGSVTSDPVALGYPYGSTIAVSLFVSGATSTLPHHNSASQVLNYLSASGSGDLTAEATGASFASETSETLLLDRVDLYGAYAGTIALAGSSTTVGYGAPAGAYQDLPDVLADDLHASGRDDLAIANMALIPDALLAQNDPGTLSVFERFQTDFLSLPSLRTIVQLAGDIDLKSGCDTALDIIAGNQRFISQAHAAGVRVVLGTVAPSTYCRGENPSGFGSRFPAGFQQDGQRDLLNAWTLSTAPSIVAGTTVQPPAADAIADLSTPLEDPANTGYVLPPYDPGDDSHVDAAGQAIQAAAIAAVIP